MQHLVQATWGFHNEYCLDLVGFDRVLPGPWRRRKGRVGGKGRDVWRGGGKEGVGQINNGILSGLGSLPLSFSLSVSVSVLFRAPAAFPSWFHSKALDMGQTGQLYDCVCLYLCVCMWLTARKCVLQPWKLHTNLIYPFFLHAMFNSLSSSSFYLSRCSFYHTHYNSISWLSLSFRSISSYRPQGSVLYDVIKILISWPLL